MVKCNYCGKESHGCIKSTITPIISNVARPQVISPQASIPNSNPPDKINNKETESKKNSQKIIAILIALLIIGTFSGAYFGYCSGFEAGNKMGYALGHDSGYASGNSTGYVNGYTIGYSAGNSIGYGLGYNAGQSAGFTAGYNKGYPIGKTEGFASGNQTGYNTGYPLGYSQGYQEGFTTTGYSVKDPTYQEAMNFINTDQTDKMTYIPGVFTCENFASTFKQHAFKQGYRCFYVVIDCETTGHAIDAFNTTDRGVIYVEPQFNKIVNVNVGTSYSASNDFLPLFGDTIKQFILIP